MPAFPFSNLQESFPVLMQLSLNANNLPYPDPLHPIIVHFVIAMVLFAFCCDVVGYLAHQPHLFEVSFWNMLVASVAVFVAIIFGQFEAGLAQTYPAVESVLTRHQVIGWSLSVLIVAITAWKLASRSQNLRHLPLPYLGVATLLAIAILMQLSLGNQLVWVYGLHVRPVAEAVQQGIITSTSEAEELPGGQGQ
jgi:uncharacterized membrane protein